MVYTIIEGENGFKRIIFPKTKSIFENVFMDMESFANPVYLPYVEKVINGASDCESIGSNNCCLDIKPDITTVSPQLTAEGKPNGASIDTNELHYLILFWAAENNQLLR